MMLWFKCVDSVFAGMFSDGAALQVLRMKSVVFARRMLASFRTMFTSIDFFGLFRYAFSHICLIYHYQHQKRAIDNASKWIIVCKNCGTLHNVQRLVLGVKWERKT